jgi:hypothetical protein
MNRRSWLALGAFSAVALAVGGGSLALIRPGLSNGHLSESGREVFAGAARGLLDGSLPQSDAAHAAALQALLARIDALVADLPSHAQGELSQLLALLASIPGRRVFADLTLSWRDASTEQLQAALQSMRFSRVSLRRQAYQALHDIAGAAYFSDESTWAQLGYPGPATV